MIFRRMHWPHSSAELVQTRDMLNHRYDEPNSGYAFHPAAFANLDKIRDYVAGNVWTQPMVSSRRSLTPSVDLFPFYIMAISAPTLVRDLCDSLSTRIPDGLRAEEKPLRVVALMYGRCSPRTIATILRGRE
jgi:hypothetical protein